MSIIIGDNFGYGGKKFLDSRESFDTLEAMKNFTQVPDGFVTYCKEDGKRYEFKSSNNINELTGKWVEFSAKSGGDDASHYVGSEAPEDENAIWFSPGVEDAASSGFTYDNPIIAELFAYIRTLQAQVFNLQADVEYLKVNGGGVRPEAPSGPTPGTGTDLFFLLEEGGYFELEDGGYLILEEEGKPSTEPALLLENDDYFELENGGIIILE